ncbi:hypothetical protein VTG60DRAFT_421 [Thermothelomyces hinnuleus]
MAPFPEKVAELAKRADGCGPGRYRDFDGDCHYYSTWYHWGRWVFAGLAILLIIIIFAALVRNSRRRRRLGRQPLYGTGWMAPAPPPYYPPPPQYSPHDQGVPPPPGGYKYGEGAGYYGGNQPNNGYYGGNQEGIQLQPPQNAYHRATDNDYAPPPGPPPKPAN